MLLCPHQWVRGRWAWGYGSVLSIIIVVEVPQIKILLGFIRRHQVVSTILIVTKHTCPHIEEVVGRNHALAIDGAWSICTGVFDRELCLSGGQCFWFTDCQQVLVSCWILSWNCCLNTSRIQTIYAVVKGLKGVVMIRGRRSHTHTHTHTRRD